MMKLRTFTGPLLEIETEFNLWIKSKKDARRFKIESIHTQVGGLLVFYTEL